MKDARDLAEMRAKEEELAVLLAAFLKFEKAQAAADAAKKEFQELLFALDER